MRAFKEMKVKPKADTPEEFAQWLREYSASSVDTKVGAKEDICNTDTKPVNNPNTMDMLVYQKVPRLPSFSGIKAKTHHMMSGVITSIDSRKITHTHRASNINQLGIL